MSDYFKPAPALLISTSRSGSAFLLNCLDSHPEIGCERSEPLEPGGIWASLKVERHSLMKVLWQRPGYKVAMFKLSYRQFGWVGAEIIKEVDPKIIHLHRRNALRVIVSSAINTAAVAGEIEHPTHSFGPVEPVKITLDPQKVLSECERYRRNTKGMTKRLRRLELSVKFLTYEEMTGEQSEAFALDPVVNQALCKFLGVSQMSMFSLTKRVNPQPLAEIVENWEEVRRVIEDSKFARYLELERV